MSTTHSANQPLDNVRSLAHEHSRQTAVGSGAYRFRLIGKEFRQLAPLLFALVGCGLILHLFGLLTTHNDRKWFHGIISILIPTLFAVGAGPMLVSQEKEQRTLGWLGSLPIPWRSIVLSKLLVGVFALACCWLISLGLAYPFESSLYRAEKWGVLESVYSGWLYWFGNTFFLFFLVFALTWLCSTGLSALIVSLIVCSATATLSSFGQSLWLQNLGVDNTFASWLILNNAIVCLFVGALAIGYGGRSFVSSATSESSSNLWDLPSWRYQTNFRPRVLTHSAASSLIWQIGLQNRMLWLACGMIVILGFGWLLYGMNIYGNPDLLGFFQLLGFLILSWLGVSVFGSDANRDRIRFLADRGVAPGLVWWTRLILPVVLVTVGMIVYYALHKALLGSYYVVGGGSIQAQLAPWTSSIIAVVMVFAFTQWFSLWFRSTLIIFCLAPVVAVGALVYTGFSYEFLGAPWWLLLASIAVAFFATRVMLCRWMDGRFGFRYWLSHGALLFISLVIPAIPLMIAYATYPAIPSSLRQSWEAESQQYGHPLRARELVLASQRGDALDDSSTGKASKESNDFSTSIDQLLQSLESQLADSTGQLTPVTRPIRFVLDTAKLASLDLETDVTNDRVRARYQQSLLLLSSILPRLRISDQVLSQEIADRLEASLVQELEQPNRKQILGPETYGKIVQSFSNQVDRDQARRRTIVMSWQAASRNEAAADFGLTWPHDNPSGFATTWLAKQRDLGLATAALLQHLEPNGTLKSISLPTSLRSYYQRVSDYNGEQFPDQLGLDWIPLPGLLWHQEWEAKAERLSNQTIAPPRPENSDD